MNSPYVISVDECWKREVFNSRTLEDALKIFENLTPKGWNLCKQSMIGVEWGVIIVWRMLILTNSRRKAWRMALNLEFQREKMKFDLDGRMRGNGRNVRREEGFLTLDQVCGLKMVGKVPLNDQVWADGEY